jgi:hypothetical protein
MGGFTALPVAQPPDPNDPNVVNQYRYGVYGYGQSPTAFGPGAVASGNTLPAFQAGYVSGAPTVDTDPQASMEEIQAADRATIASTGAEIGSEAASELNYYSPLQQGFQTAQDAALNELKQTPGFTPQEASQINVDYSQFNTSPDQYKAMAGDPNAPVAQLEKGQTGVQGTLSDYIKGAQGALGSYQSGLTGAVDTGTQGETAALYAGAGNVRGAVGQLDTGIGTAEGGLRSGIQGSEDFSRLDRAVDNPALGFDPNNTERQLTNRDVNDLIAQGATTIRNQYQGAEDLMERQARQQGDTSPAALAAMRQQLLTQEGSSEADAMTNARISALQAQYGRAADIERQRIGAAQTQAGMQATAGTTEEAARQAGATTAGLSAVSAAEFAGAQGIGAEQQLTDEALRTEALETGQKTQAQEALGTAGLASEDQYGRFAVNTDVGQTGQLLTAQQTADAQAASRATTAAGMQYGEGVGSTQLTSGGAQTVGGARQAGMGAYRSGVAQQQGMAQQGGQAAVGQQQGAYSTMTSGLNSSAGSQGAFEVGKPSLGDTAGKQATALFADGGIVTEPTVARLGERGPEMVIPLTPGLDRGSVQPGRYRSLSTDKSARGKQFNGNAPTAAYHPAYASHYKLHRREADEIIVPDSSMTPDWGMAA